MDHLAISKTMDMMADIRETAIPSGITFVNNIPKYTFNKKTDIMLTTLDVHLNNLLEGDKECSNTTQK